MGAREGPLNDGVYAVLISTQATLLRDFNINLGVRELKECEESD